MYFSTKIISALALLFRPAIHRFVALWTLALFGSALAASAATLEYSGHVNFGWVPPSSITADFGDTIKLNNVSSSNYTMNVDSVSTGIPAPTAAEQFTVNIARGSSFSFVIDNAATFVFTTRFCSVRDGSCTATRSSTVNVNPASVPGVPLPAGGLLLLTALIGAAGLNRRAKRAA